MNGLAMKIAKNNIIVCEFNYNISALDITVKSMDMRTGFYECNEHNRANRKKAIEEMPYASKVVAVVGGYMGFESWTDYGIWKNQK